MTAEHRDNPVTRETVWRVYHLSEELRAAIRQRRQALGQSLREFLGEAVETELPGLLAVLREQLPAAAGALRPARLPLTAPLLETLRSAGAETGLPVARLLLACLGRAAARKRRRGSARGTGQTAPGSGNTGAKAQSRTGRGRRGGPHMSSTAVPPVLPQAGGAKPEERQ